MQAQSQQSQQPQAQTSQQSPTNPQLEGRGRVEIQDDGSRSNRTTYVVNDDGDDPLDLEPKKPKEDAEKHDVPSQTEKVLDEPEKDEKENEQVQDVGDEEKPDKPNYDEKFNTDLDKVLEARTGVNLDGITQALTTLLGWYNDIISAEAQQSSQAQPQSITNTVKAPPSFQRSQGRNPSPAANAYDFKKSEILAMSDKEYAANAQKITNAYLNNRVYND